MSHDFDDFETVLPPLFSEISIFLPLFVVIFAVAQTILDYGRPQ